jgi:uncharacterized membrane protein
MGLTKPPFMSGSGEEEIQPMDLLRSFRNAFISGFVLLLPIGVTVFLFLFLIEKVGEPVSNNILKPILGLFFENVPSEGLVKQLINLIATIIVVIMVTSLGFISNFFFGKFIVRLTEQFFDRLPFINTVYRAVKQIVDTFSKQQKAVFQKVVLIQFPREGTYAIGFLTSDAKGEVQHRTGKEVANVFVPTTPNPTSGFLLMIPKDEIIEMRMSISEGMKLIISGGAVVPPFHGGSRTRPPMAIKNPSLMPAGSASNTAHPKPE